MAIPRDDYLEAVQRQEHRAWAHRTDPQRRAKLFLRVAEIRNHFLSEGGEDVEPLPDQDAVAPSDPAVFDTEEEIRRDDMLIGAYLSDNPDEQRRPNARGHTHDELLEYWRSSPEGLKWREDERRAMMPRLRELRDRFLAEDS